MLFTCTSQRVYDSLPSILVIALEAGDPQANHFRARRAEIFGDLFGIWWTDLTFGRLGTPYRRVASAPPGAIEYPVR